MPPQGRPRSNAIVGRPLGLNLKTKEEMDRETTEALTYMQQAVNTRVADVLRTVQRVQVKGFGTFFDVASGVKEIGSSLKELHGAVSDAGKAAKEIATAGSDFIQKLGSTLAGGKLLEAVQHVFKDWPDNIIVEILKHIGAEALAEFTEAVTPFVGPLMKLGTGLVGFIQAGYSAYQGYQLDKNMVLIRGGDVALACRSVIDLWDEETKDKALNAALDSCQGIIGIGLAAGDAAGGGGAASTIGGAVMAAARALYAFGVLLKELFDAFMECRAVNAMIAKGRVTATELFEKSPTLGAWVVTLLESSTLAAFMIQDIGRNPNFMIDFEKRFMEPVSNMKQAAFKMIAKSRIEPVAKIVVGGKEYGKYEVKGGIKKKLVAYVKSGPSRIKFTVRFQLLQVQNKFETFKSGVRNGANAIWKKIHG